MSYPREPTFGYSIPCCFSLHNPPLEAWSVELEISKAMSVSGCWAPFKSDLHQTWPGFITVRRGSNSRTPVPKNCQSAG